MDILPTVTIPTSPHPGRPVLRQRQLPPFRAVTPPGRRPTPTTPLNVRLPRVSVTPRGLHDLIPQRLLIETADVTIEIGIVNAVVGIYKSTPLPPLIRCLLHVPTRLLIMGIALLLVLFATTVHLNHLQETLISRSQAGRTLPRGPRINPLRLVLLLLNPSLSLSRPGGMTQEMTAGIPGNSGITIRWILAQIFAAALHHTTVLPRAYGTPFVSHLHLLPPIPRGLRVHIFHSTPVSRCRNTAVPGVVGVLRGRRNLNRLIPLVPRMRNASARGSTLPALSQPV